MRGSKSSVYDRSLFKNDRYLEHFRPEEAGSPFERIYREKLVDVISLVEGSNLHILDVGGGMGRMSVPLARSHRVVLCDLSWSMLTTAAGFDVPDLRYVQADALRLPFDDGAFDYVLAVDLLVHVETPLDALGEFARVLRPDGKLIVDSTNSNPLWTLFYPGYVGRSPVRWARTMRGGGVLPEWQAIVTHYPKARFIKMLSEAGFLVLEKRDYGPNLCPKWNLAVAVKQGSDVVANAESGRRMKF